MKPVVIPSSIARCPTTRQVPCMKADTCARALCDPTNRPVQDYSIEQRGANGECSYYLDASMHRPEPFATGPRVHESVQGIC